jgi:hypothetical protein
VHDRLDRALVHFEDRRRDRGELAPGCDPLCDDPACSGRISGVRPPASGSGPPRRWRPRSAGQRSRALEAEGRSAPCSSPSSFRPTSGGRSRWPPARPVVPVPKSSPDGDHAVWADPVRCLARSSSAVGSAQSRAVSGAEMAKLNIKPADFHGEWNYFHVAKTRRLKQLFKLRPLARLSAFSGTVH